jgi:nicotinamide-nucleotide amidase
MNEFELLALGEAVVEKYKENGLTLSVAESCTGGWLSKIITEISGASEIFMGGVCSYSNDVKQNVLGVKEETLKSFGAVSEETVTEMALGAIKASGADVSVAVSGIAGPLSDNTSKPVGLIWLAVCVNGKVTTKRLNNTFDVNIRENNRNSAANEALRLLCETIETAVN